MATMLVRPGLWVSSSGEFQIVRVRQQRWGSAGFTTVRHWKVTRWNRDARQYEDIAIARFRTLNDARQWVSRNEQESF